MKIYSRWVASVNSKLNSIWKTLINVSKEKKVSGSQDPFFSREAEKYPNPIASREHILALFSENKAPLLRKKIEKKLGIKTEEAQEGLRRRLKAMMRDGQILKTRSGYVSLEGEHELVSDLETKLNFDKDAKPYVSVNGEKLWLSYRLAQGLFEGDIVKVKLVQETPEKKYASLVGLVKAVEPKMIGTIIHDNGYVYVLPIDKRYQRDILIYPASKELEDLKDKEIVEVTLSREPVDLPNRLQKKLEPDQWVGQVSAILGDPKKAGFEIEWAIHKYNLPTEFQKPVVDFTKKIPKKIPASVYETRTDLRSLPFVTIDGEDAKDFDDAVYTTKREKDYILYVAIADVSHYVTPGSPLDLEAKNRGNSTYFPGLAIPMLPEVLSNGLCSLKPDEDRLAMVAEIRIDFEGAIKRSRFYPAVICSKARLTYTEVAGMLNENPHVLQQHENIVQHVFELNALYELLNKQREHRAALDFNTVETKIYFDLKGKVESIRPSVRLVSHKIIEECMLVANVCAAKLLKKHKEPTLYRVHEGPSVEKLTALRAFLSELGVDMPGGKTPSPQDYKKVLEAVKDREDAHIIETVLLRSLSQAEYLPQMKGHFGLAYDAYVHFTSPIRRYPDLLVHRGIKHILAKIEHEKTAEPEIISAEHAAENKAVVLKSWEETGLQCSTTERRSDEASRFCHQCFKVRIHEQ
jgi:ribonuclease R